MSTYLPTYKRLHALEAKLIVEFRGEYGRLLVATSNLVKQALLSCRSQEEFDGFIRCPANGDGFYTEAVEAMLDGEDYKPILWSMVQDNIADILTRIFSGPEEPCLPTEDEVEAAELDQKFKGWQTAESNPSGYGNHANEAA